MGQLEFGVRRYRSHSAPQGRVAEPSTGTSHASMVLIVAAGTTRDSDPLLPPTVRASFTEPHAKPPQPPPVTREVPHDTPGLPAAGRL